MRFRRRRLERRITAIEPAVTTGSTAQPAPSPEWVALLLATEHYVEADKARSALGGYVPIGHPGHPSKWSAARQDALADADARVLRATEALQIASLAHTNPTAT